jgi:hypothetical protein
MTALPQIKALLTPQQTRRALRDLSGQLPSKDPLARLLSRIADADLSCINEIWQDDLDSAQFAIDELPDLFQAVVDELQDALNFAQEAKG